ncbi:hypothetical protein N431DRAFT_438066 [Stipitochalara longipes BDJ]|nr:hypothetical protein N431DRAFT_438066 [Stipitochalara longipes BDJ]
MATPLTSSSRTEEIAILATVQKFLAGIKARNPAQMHACIHPSGGHALLIRPSPSSSKTKQHLSLTLAEVVDRIPFDSPEELEENIALAEWEEGDDGTKYGGRKSEVRVDHDLAVVWTPYEVRKDGNLSHVGTNVFSLVKEADGESRWLICWVSDTWRVPREEMVWI